MDTTAWKIPKRRSSPCIFQVVVSLLYQSTDINIRYKHGASGIRGEGDNYAQGRREGGGGGGQIAPNFLLGPSHFLGEIFPRKGQDIWFF